jgi:hypothetical protein
MYLTSSEVLEYSILLYGFIQSWLYGTVVKSESVVIVNLLEVFADSNTPTPY